MSKKTKLSTKGQVVIPQEVRDRHGWRAGAELWIEDRADHLVLRAAPEAPETTLDELAGATGYRGPRKSLAEMEAGIAKGVPQGSGAVRRVTVKALDTNLVVRLVTWDDPEQAERVRQELEVGPLWLPKTVLLETEWVLRYSYELDRGAILAAFWKLLGYRPLHVEDREAVLRAVSWYAGGLDFADALHLSSSPEADAFLTFDRPLATRATELDTHPPVRRL
jgi:AbrB family looped-hinge helix DNA binding protein